MEVVLLADNPTWCGHASHEEVVPANLALLLVGKSVRGEVAWVMDGLVPPV
jgi:hypothetical protein